MKQIHEKFHFLVDIARAEGRIHPDAVGAILGWNLIDRGIRSLTEESQLRLVISEIKKAIILIKAPQIKVVLLY